MIHFSAKVRFHESLLSGESTHLNFTDEAMLENFIAANDFIGGGFTFLNTKLAISNCEITGEEGYCLIYSPKEKL